MNGSLKARSQTFRWRSAIGADLTRAILWGAVAGAVGAAVRYGLIEARFFRSACDVDSMPTWCWPRFILIWTFNNWLLGSASAALGAWALIRPRRRGVALAAIVLGATGLALYDADLASVGLVLGLISVSRARA